MKLPKVIRRTRTRPGVSDFLELTERELCRIVLDIHDGPVQDMYAALSQIDALHKRLTGADEEGRPSPEAIAHSLTQISTLIRNALWSIRNFIGAFAPPEFQKRDLVSVVEGLILQHEELTGCRVELSVTPPIPDVATPVKIVLYRILQEALSNAYRHAGTDRQYVHLYPRDGGVGMEVWDEGVGFDVERVLTQVAADRRLRVGLRGMRDRAALVGGTVHIESRPGQGTRITVWVPGHAGRQ